MIFILNYMILKRGAELKEIHFECEWYCWGLFYLQIKFILERHGTAVGKHVMQSKCQM
jgi:hypothetical protein